MWNLSANCTLLISYWEIILTNLEPLQPYFFCLNCICSLITITITITIPIPSQSPPPWQLFRPLKPYFTFSILPLHHPHHPGFHNVRICNMTPYSNWLLYCCLSSNAKLCQSTLMDSVVRTVDSPHRAHQCTARVPEYVHYWQSICCSTTPPGCRTPSDLCRSSLIHLLVDSMNVSRRVHEDRAGTPRYINRYLSICCCSASPIHTVDPFRRFPDHLWLTWWYAKSIRLDLAGARMLRYIYDSLFIRCSSSSSSCYSSSSSS